MRVAYFLIGISFKDLTTLRTDARLFDDLEQLQWRGPNGSFATYAEKLGDKRLRERSRKAQKKSNR